MADFIVIMIILAIVGIAVTYIIKEKKRGAHCIGCPQAGSCMKKQCNGSAETTGNKQTK